MKKKEPSKLKQTIKQMATIEIFEGVGVWVYISMIIAFVTKNHGVAENV